MRVLFRADASPSIGGGHVMRCLTLAGELARRGGNVTFAVSPATPASVPALARSAYDVIELDDDPTTALPVPPQGYDIIVVDSYAIDAAAERRFRELARSVVVIDDLANRPHDCDILVDQNLGRLPEHYAGLVPGHCRVLTGVRFSLLREEFAALRPKALSRQRASFRDGGGVRRILVSLGLTDVGGITAMVVPAVLASASGAHIDVVLGAVAPSLPLLRALAASRDDLTIHVDTSRMSGLMAEADLAIGAAGSTSWERCCLGLPSLMLVLADNQRSVAAHLAASGAAIAIESGPGAGQDIELAVAALVRDAHRREAMSTAAARLVDGAGAARVGDEVMTALPG